MLHTSITIRAPAAVVWQILTDLPGYREWNPFIREADGELREGARLEVTLQPPDGRRMRFRPRVLKVKRQRELRWLGHLGVPGLFDGEHIFQIRQAGQSAVEFSQSESFKGLLVGMLSRRLDTETRRGFEAMNQALKSRAERQVRQTRRG